MERIKLIRSEDIQVVRLSSAMSFPEDVDEVLVRKNGNERILSPAIESWDSFFSRTEYNTVSEDFAQIRATQEQHDRLSFDD